MRTAVPEERRGSESLSSSLMTYTLCEKDCRKYWESVGKVKRVVSGKYRERDILLRLRSFAPADYGKIIVVVGCCSSSSFKNAATSRTSTMDVTLYTGRSRRCYDL